MTCCLVQRQIAILVGHRQLCTTSNQQLNGLCLTPSCSEVEGRLFPGATSIWCCPFVQQNLHDANLRRLARVRSQVEWCIIVLVRCCKLGL